MYKLLALQAISNFMERFTLRMFYYAFEFTHGATQEAMKNNQILKS